MGPGADRHPILVEDLGDVVGMGAFDGEAQDRRLARRRADDPHAVDAVQLLDDPLVEGVFVGEGRVTVRLAKAGKSLQDIRAAISFLAGEPSVDPQRIGIMGSSYGGVLVTYMAGNDPRVKCVVAQVPGLGGANRDRALAAAYKLHTQQARGETEPVPLETGKMTGKMEKYSNMRTNAAKSIGFSGLEAAAKINVPALFVVAENEELSNNDIVAEAQKTSKEFADKQQKEAIEKATSLISKAQEAIELEKKKMLAEARTEIARLVVATTERVLAKKLTDADRASYNESAARELTSV